MNGSLKIIATVAVGYDNIDLPAAKERNIIINNAPNVINNAVAEITLLLMLGAARRAT
jgi:glyoxylate reductase